MARNRLEDLGRLCVLISQLVDHDLFGTTERFNKHATIEEHLEGLDEEKRAEWLWRHQYQIGDVRDQLYECLEIAKGYDILNDKDA